MKIQSIKSKIFIGLSQPVSDAIANAGCHIVWNELFYPSSLLRVTCANGHLGLSIEGMNISAGRSVHAAFRLKASVYACRCMIKAFWNLYKAGTFAQRRLIQNSMIQDLNKTASRFRIPPLPCGEGARERSQLRRCPHTAAVPRRPSLYILLIPPRDRAKQNIFIL
jgi:hypothetical protein